jgi:hypothetical protein
VKSFFHPVSFCRGIVTSFKKKKVYNVIFYTIYLTIFFWWDWRLNLGLCASKAGALPLEPHLQSIFALVIFGDGLFVSYLPGLALNCNSPDLSLPTS